MAKKIHLTKEAPAPIGPYSQAVEANGFIFCSGQIALDAQSGQVVSGGVAEQTEKVMENIAAVLKSADVGFDKVIKTTIFLLDMNDFSTVNAIYGRFFEDKPPARSTVAVTGLPKGVRVEIEVTAVRV